MSDKMRIALVNTMQSGGGAAIAAMRLFDALKKTGADVQFITAIGKGGDNITVLSTGVVGKLIYKLNFITERLVIWINNRMSRRNLFTVSIANTGFDITRLKAVQQADIIHLHWVNQGLMSVAGIKKLIALGKPVVITAHDMWYCTAICHHSFGCERFMSECKECRFLAAPSDNDLSAHVWRDKINMYTNNVSFIALGHWIKRQLERSALTRNINMTVIPNSIETSLFHQTDKTDERKKRGIKDNAKVIIFGAAKLNDPIKGAEILFDAIAQSRYVGEIVLVLFGNIKDDENFLNRIPCRYIYIGTIADQAEQAGWYSSADIAAVPSHYETLPQVMIEALACGTPAVAFD
ncbi:MAG: glycosyltransferase, partial [Bacteroidales bacterium]